MKAFTRVAILLAVAVPISIWYLVGGGPDSGAIQGPSTTLILGVGAALAGLVFFGGGLFRRGKSNKQLATLRETFVHARARILDRSVAKESSPFPDRNPYMHILLLVKATNGEEYEQTTKRIIPAIHNPLIAPGEDIPVRVNPDNREEVFIDLGDVWEDAVGKHPQPPLSAGNFPEHANGTEGYEPGTARILRCALESSSNHTNVTEPRYLMTYEVLLHESGETFTTTMSSKVFNGHAHLYTPGLRFPVWVRRNSGRGLMIKPDFIFRMLKAEHVQ